MRILALLLGLVPTRAFASNLEKIGGGPGIAEMWGMIKSVFPHTELGSGGLQFFLLKITDFTLKSIAAIAVIMIIYAGIKMITGAEEGIGEAKKIVQYAAMGLILAILADAIVIYASVLIAAASA